MAETVPESTMSAGQIPQLWRRPAVIGASLGINMLGLALPVVTLQVYDRIIPNQALTSFLFLLVGLGLVVVLDTTLRILRSMLLGWEGARYDHDESLRTMHAMLHARSSDFEKHPAGYYLDRVQALEKIQEFYSGQSMLLVLDFPFALVYLSLVWMIAGNLVLIPIVLLLMFAAVSIRTGAQLHTALEHRSKIEDGRRNFIIETLTGIHTIKSMAMEPFMQRRYERLQSQSAESVYELSRINSLAQGVGASFSQMAVISFASIGSFYVIDGSLSVGAVAAGTMLSNLVLQPGLRAMGFWTQFQSVRLARSKASDLAELPQERSNGVRAESGLRGSIKLTDVHFRYPGQDKDLLAGITLDIRAGEAIGITGDNGAGKSTLINLLSGFVEPQSGSIALDGLDLGDYDISCLRRQIGIVPQFGTLFEGTLLENLTLYREGEATRQALELARDLGLGEIIAQLPDGLDTHLGGAAVDTLPGAAKQKIIMVRSLVGNPSVILFDDANANFDIRNDRKLVALLERMKGKRTMVIVSHRPSFLRLCDRRFAISHGGLIDDPMANQGPPPSATASASSGASRPLGEIVNG